jgi:hypothetical protein
MVFFKKIFVLFLGLLFFKAEGQEIFQKTYFDSSYTQSFNDVVTLEDSTYLLAGGHSDSTNNVLLTKIDKTGNILWNKQYRIGRSATAVQILKINNNSFTIVGSASFDSLFSSDYFIMSVDSNGNVAWMHGYSSSYAITAHTIKCLTGGYLTIPTLYYNPLVSRNNLLIKFDDSGNIIWQKEFHKIERMYLVSIAEGIDGSVYMGGIIRDSISSWIGYALLIKADSSGTLSWSKSFLADTSTYNYISSIKIEMTGSISLLGDYFYSNGDSQMFLIKMDINGNILNSSSLNMTNNLFSTTHRFIADNRIGILADHGLIVIDSLNNISFAKGYIVQSGTASISNFVQTNDKGFLLVGASGITPYSAYLVKADSSGDAGCHQGNYPMIILPVSLATSSYPNFLDTTFQFNTYTDYIIDTATLSTTIWCETATEIDESDSKNEIIIQPNPFTSELTVQSSEKIKQIIIYSLIGETVYQKQLTSNQTSAELNLSFLQQGVYFLNVKTNGESWTKKMVKM